MTEVVHARMTEVVHAGMTEVAHTVMTKGACWDDVPSMRDWQ